MIRLLVLLKTLEENSMVEWKKIEDLGSYFGGLTGKTKKDFEDGNAKFITYMNVFANPSLDESTVGMVHINEGEKQNRVQKGDILFTGSSETPDEAGMSCVVTDDLLEDYYMNSFCFGLRLNIPEQYNLHYLKHLLRSYSIRSEISKTASGVTRFNISKARFGKVLIPIPSLSEQSRIVGILDTFTASIENLKQQIAQRRKQYEHYRDQLLDLEGKEGVEMKTLGEICIIKNGYTPSTKNPDFWNNGSLPWFTLEDIRKNGRVLVDAIKHITPSGVKKGGVFQKDSLIVSTTATIGEYAIIKTDFLCNQQITCLSIKEICKKQLLPKFLYYLADGIGKWCKQNVNGGGSLLIVSTSKLQKKPIPVPSLQDQSRIVSILDTFEASIANLEQQLAQRERQYEYYRNKLLTFE